MERITATEAARRLSDLLNRVRYRGEAFTITRGGEVVAELAPSPSADGVPLAELVERVIAVRSGDPEFAEDLERIQRDQAPPELREWPS
jgi:prevent-host-death family protein